MRLRIAILTTVFLVLGIGAVRAIDDRVRRACERDYLSYCARHDPDGREVRTCMSANGTRLTQACVDALIATGAVSKEEVARRRKADR